MTRRSLHVRGATAPVGSAAQRGVSLVELMIALVLGLLLIGGVIGVFLGTSQTYRTQEAQTRVQESGRFAIERLSRDIRQAGNFGCRRGYEPEVPRADGVLEEGGIRNTLNPDPPDPPAFSLDFSNPIVGFDGTGTAWAPIAPVVPGIVNPDPVSDIIVLGLAVGPGIAILDHPEDTAPLDVGPGTTFVCGEILIASTCRGASIFQVASATACNIATTGEIAHEAGTPGGVSPGNWTANLGQRFEDGEVFRADRVAYYVAPGSERGTSLFRNTEEVVENVEQFQVRFGEDTDGDGTVNLYRAANTVGDWERVVAVRATLLVSSGDTENVVEAPQTLAIDGQAFNAPDRRLYRTFTTTVSLRNRLD